MCKFGLEENNRIRHSVTMYGHLDDCFIRISKILPQYIPEQIENHYKKYLDEEAPPINYERIFETYEKLQAININTCYMYENFSFYVSSIITISYQALDYNFHFIFFSKSINNQSFLRDINHESIQDLIS
ncbi:hypothetical protein RhiirA5_433943 [Rhizophagus irregularis]|uniref:Uncharacterized protein n=1 Tax=Rhizophagus irregularis TaxID=588596 RepID=A0A2I1FEY7_9GLOM|nr:hypothetical protein RhiirA5_433943 [Rhizophagus irregularis]PKY32926.1 hypothetical protein RhiirB3_451468 [Rhizophagus irregularis]CAB4486013.1 unnamed protein product [Rhizophagus irregularis]CAB5387217.1 unnamed protein product [Rhizophagus irregularis]